MAEDSQIELVVFDMAGTTVDDGDAVTEILQRCLGAFGVAVTTEEVLSVMGLSKPQSIARLLARHNASHVSIEQVHAEFVATMLRAYAELPNLREYPGARDTFRRIRAAGIRVGLDTGFSRDIASVILNRLGWSEGSDDDGVIDAVVASDQVARGRPYPDLIQAHMRRFGIEEPARVAKVGDTPVDLQQGANSGCGLIIGVTGRTHTREELLSYPHTHLITSLAEVPAILGIR